MWSKYRVQKKQIYQNGGWVDTDPLQTRTGEKIGEYDSFSGCSGIPPIFIKKLTANYSDSSTYTIDCNGSSVLTSGETNSYSTPVYMMTSATIGYCVTEIGKLAFRKYNSQGIQNLSSVTLSDSVTTIDDMAFMGCSNLTTINLDNVTSIGLAAFRECGNLVLNDLPSGLTNISNEAFVWVRLQNCTIPSGVTTIGLGAFAGCDEMSTLTIPSGVTSIGEYAFQGCSGLTSITVEAITPPTLGYNVFINSGSCPIYVPCSSVATYKASSGWSEYASRIHGIPPCSEPVPPTPSNYKWLAAYSDSHTESAECDASSAITSGEVTKEGLQSFGIGNCVTSIGNDAFDNCSGLTSITIPDSVTSIGDRTFWNCFSLTNITIPNGVTSIGTSAFAGCNTISTLTIPSSVTSIGTYAFATCSGLTSITIPSGVTSIGRGTFGGCYSLTSVTIPDSVTSIGDKSFTNCFSLTNIRIPNGVTSIGVSVFEGCSGLTSITIPSGVTSIEQYAFFKCNGLTSITIPDSVTSIGEHAFRNCSGLTGIIVNATTPPTLGNRAFDNTNDCLIRVPAASLSAYQNAWPDYVSRIVAIP